MFKTLKKNITVVSLVSSISGVQAREEWMTFKLINSLAPKF